MACFGGVVCRGHRQTPWFCSPLFRSDSLQGRRHRIGLFVNCCPEFAPAAHAHSYFQPLIVSLYFVA